MPFHSGVDGRGWFGATELDISRFTLTIRSNNKDVSGTKVGRHRVAGLPDASGSFTMHYNSDEAPWAAPAPNIRHGTIGDLSLVPSGETDLTDPTKAFRLKAIIDDVTPSSEIEGVVDYVGTFSLQDGRTLLYPGDPVPAP